MATILSHPEHSAARSEIAHSSSVDISVLVPVRNEERHVAASVAAMLAQKFSGTIEFIFADGCSSDGTRPILERLADRDGRIRILDNPRRRTPHGLNLCLREARGTFVARMDAHAEYPSDYLARGVERLGRGDVVWVSGPQLPRGDGWWSSRVTLALQSSLGSGGSRRWQSPSRDRGCPEEEFSIRSASGVFLGVWRRATLIDFGGWDEGWPVNQDVELAARLESRGERIVSLGAMGAHYIPRNSPLSLARQYFRYGYYRVKTSRRHPVALRASHLGAPCVVAGLVVSCLPAPGISASRMRRVARAASVAYGGAVLVAGGRVTRRDAPGDWLLIPSAMAVMHISWGVGFLTGCARLGPPVNGLRNVGRDLLRRLRFGN